MNRRRSLSVEHCRKPAFITARKIFDTVLPALFWLLVWQGVAMLLRSRLLHGSLLLASPLETLARLFCLVGTTEFWNAVLCSALHIMLGFLSGLIAAVILSAFSAGFRPLQMLMKPLITVISAVPVVSFIILLLIWSDASSLSTIISGLMVFPVYYSNLLAGFQNADFKLIETARVFKMTVLSKIRAIYLPAAVPPFLAATRLALGLCWKSGIAAEVIGIPAGTIGEYLYRAKVYFQTPDLFAYTLTIIFLSMVAERAILAILRRILRRYIA